MKVHLLLAHPASCSFNAALHKIAKTTFKENGIDYVVSDLYKDNFNPVASHKDATGFPTDSSFNMAKAQRWATENNSFEASIKIEQQKLIESDLLILQFPLWWWSFPAVLKGWIDRVLSSGFAYGKGATLAPKKIMYSITTGGASNKEELAYYQNKIDGLYQDIFGFIGWEILPPFIAHGVQHITNIERQKLIIDFKTHLEDKVIKATIEQVTV